VKVKIGVPVMPFIKGVSRMLREEAKKKDKERDAKPHLQDLQILLFMAVLHKDLHFD